MIQAAKRGPYKNPPIEEALIEFRFVPRPEWDPTIPGKLHQHAAIKEQYPGTPRQQKVFQANLQASPGQIPGFAVQEGIGRIQLVNADGRRLLSIGTDVLTIHMLRPYEGWETFRPRIDTALSAYQEVADATSVTRIGVRYINKIVIADNNFELATYFRGGPVTSIEGMPEVLDEFMSRVGYQYPDGVKILLTHASLPPEQGKAAFLLDIDAFTQLAPPLSIDKSMAVVDDLHDREGRVFEAMLTDKLRSVFDAV